MNNPYDDIIGMPHHVSKNHPQMSMRDRAAQFSPFAALVGYEDAIDETGRQTDEKHELSEQEQAELDHRLSILVANVKNKPEIHIKYFVPDARKVGGSYKVITGNVRQISIPERMLKMIDGNILRIDDIVGIDGQLFEDA